MAGYIAILLTWIVPAYWVYTEKGLRDCNICTACWGVIMMVIFAVEMAKLYDSRLKKPIVEIMVWVAVYIGVILFLKDNIEMKSTAVCLTAMSLATYSRCYYILCKNKTLLDDLLRS